MKIIKCILLLVTLTSPNWTFLQKIQSKEQRWILSTKEDGVSTYSFWTESQINNIPILLQVLKKIK